MPIPYTGNAVEIVDPKLAHAQQVISGTYTTHGATRTSSNDPVVRVSVYDKRKDLIKLGRSDQVQTTNTTLMTLPTGTFNETYVNSNTITHFASASAGDTVQLVVEGHTVDADGYFTFVVQTVTLAGQTKTALTTPLARATRAYNIGATDLTGPVYFAENVTFTAGVPQTNSAVHLMIGAGENISYKGSTTISDTDYWIITGVSVDILTKAAAFADVELQFRPKGSVFRDLAILAGDAHYLPFDPYIIIPSNSDVRMVASADQNGRSVMGTIQGYLASVI